MELDAQTLEIGEIARHQHQEACLASGGNQGIHRAKTAPGPSRPSKQAAASIGDGDIDRRDSALEASWQLLAKPLFQSSAAAAWGQALHPEADFGKADNAEQYAVLIDLVEPADNHRVRPGLDPF